MSEKPAASAFDRAVRLLAQRPHFRQELCRKLRRKGYEPAEIEAAAGRLAELGYLDDDALARTEAERLRERRGLSRAGLAAELGRKGAAREAIEAALAGRDREDELAAAREAGRRWSRRGRTDATALARHLDRKGYPAEIVRQVLDELGGRGGAG